MGMTYARRKAQSGKRKRSLPMGLLGMAWGAKKARSSRAKYPSTGATPRRALRARKATRKRRGPKFKIGSYSGDLISSKAVTLPKKCARIRRREFGSTIGTNRCWVSGNSTGSEYYFMSLIAEGITTYLLSRMGDTRADKDHGGSTIMRQFEIDFIRDDNSGSLVPPEVSQITARMTLDQQTSFNSIVYNDSVLFPKNNVKYDGVDAPVMIGLNRILYNMAIAGLYPCRIRGYRIDHDGADDKTVEVFRDDTFGQGSLAIDIRGVHKFQNVTPAREAGVAGTSNYNVNAIDANPLEGKIMTFRNLAPTWNKGWLDIQSTAPLEAFSGRPHGDYPSSWDYPQASNAATGTTTGLPNIPELEAAPLRPMTIFSNCSRSTPVRFPPGGFKVFKTHFAKAMPLRTLIRDLTMVMADNHNVPTPTARYVNGKYPSLGDSFMMCLLPTIKTTLNEDVTMAWDFVRDGRAMYLKYKGGAMPTTNMIQ